MRLDWRPAILLALFLGLAAGASAQTTENDWTAGALVSYNLADLEGDDPLAGFAAEIDIAFDGVPISIVGHVSRHEPDAQFAGAGLRVTHPVGPLEVFGHYLFGGYSTGDAATDGVDQRRGGGINVPLGDRAFVRLGADHNGEALFTVVGLGMRW